MSVNRVTRQVLVSLFFLLTSLSAAPLHADPIDRGWTIGPTAGILWGEAREIAHYDDNLAYPNQNDYLSLLLWDLKNIPTAGLELRWENGRHLGVFANISAAFPGSRAGEMDDFDWVYTDMDWSHWSQSDVWLRWGFVADLGAEITVAEPGPWTLRLGAVYHLDSWAWTDIIKDSVYSTTNSSGSYPAPYGTYSGENFRDTDISTEYGKNGIDYEVTYHSILLTMRWRYRGDVFFAGITGRIGPALAMALDYHKLRTDYPGGLQIWDIGLGGPWIDGTLEAGFRTRGRFSMTLRGDIAWLAETRANSFYYDGYGNFQGGVSGGGGFGFLRGGLSLYFSWTLDPLYPLSSP